MDKPHIPDAPGLAWRPRKNGWAAVWLARQDIAKKGFTPTTHQLGSFTAPPSEAEENNVRTNCVRLQEEMYAFVEGKKPGVYDGTLRGLFRVFETDPDSNFHSWDHDTRRDFGNHVRHLVEGYGHLTLAKASDDEQCVNGRTFRRIYERTRWPAGKDDSKGKISQAYARIGVLRTLFSFGVAFEIDTNCVRIRDILSELRFENGKARTESMTLRQCEDIIAAAHELELPSIALAQAIQFDWRVRQRDVIGIWVPEREPGISVIPALRGRKWLRGMRHEEFSGSGIINHPTSKGRRFGKVIERDINLYPMAKAEYDRIPDEARFGPLVICELTGRPWKQNHFRIKWRECARRAGVPDSVWNMDNRASGITETIEATDGNVETARKEAGHSDIKTTMRYSRRKGEAVRDAAAKVLDFRGKNRA